MTDPRPCDHGTHTVVLDEHGAGQCACGMVRRYPARERLERAETVAEAEEA